MTQTTESLQLRSLVTESGELELSLTTVEVPDPGPDEVLVRVEAAPINPSDLALLLGPVVAAQGSVSGSGADTVFRAPIPEAFRPMLTARVGDSMGVGNEGAGTVVKAGSSDAAQALLGKTVAVAGGDMFSQYRCVNVFQALPLQDGTTARQGASAFVNPLTALAMVDTMRAENHTALVHTAAASNLGQMLNKICQAEGIELVNIVRKPDQVELLRGIGAKYVLNSSDDDFLQQLTAACQETGATLAFDATGGGRLANTILTAMERAAAAEMPYNRYGSDVFKQVYIYGRLDLTPTELTPAYGFAWSVSGFLLTPFMQKVGMERVAQLQQRVAAELDTTFASHYTAEISLAEALLPENMSVYERRSTGEKFLINPQL